MTSAGMNRSDHITAREGNRVLTFYGLLLANLGSFGILFFWLIGAIHLWTGNGGQINLIGFEGLESILFWSFPFVVLASLAAWLLFLARLELIALGLAGAPVALALLYYLALVLMGSLRP